MVEVQLDDRGTKANGTGLREVRSVALVLGLLVYCCSFGGLAADDAALRVRKVFSKLEHDVRVQMGDGERGPTINRHGDILFGVSGVQGEGMWLIPNDGRSVCIATKDQLPGLDAAPLESRWRHYILNDAGMAAFHVSLTLPSSIDVGTTRQTSGIWSYEPKVGLQHVIMDGDPAVGLQDMKFDLRFATLFLSQTRKIGFQTTVTPIDEHEHDPTSSVNSGFWTWQNGQLQIVGPIHDTAILTSVMNARGHVARAIAHRSPYSEIVVFANGTERIAMPRLPQLNPPGIERLVVTGADGLSFNNAGQVAFETRARSPKDGLRRSIWRDGFAIANPGVLEPKLMHIDGMKLDGKTVGKVDGNSFTLLNKRGDFASSERNHYLADAFHGICYAPGGESLRIVADAQNPAPGVDAVFAAPAGSGVINGVLNANRLSYVFGQLVLNARGQLAFTAHLGGNVTPENDRGLWATQADAQNLQLIARTGDTIKLGDDDVRTIEHISFAGPSGNEDGRPSGMNDDGRIVFAVRFTDGSVAVVQSDAVAGEAGVSDFAPVQTDLARPTTVDQSAAATALAKWEEAAKRRLVKAKAEVESSDNQKLTRLAQSLRDEYKQLLAEAIAWQVEHPRALNDVEQDPAHRARQLRLQHLPQIWDGLRRWPYNNRREDTTTESQREFEAATSRLLGEYGHLEFVSKRVATVQLQLKRYTAMPIVRVRPKSPFDPKERIFAFSTNRLELEPFSAPIGEVLPEPLKDQPDVFPNDNAVDGPLVQLREQIRPLIKLALQDDGRLQIDEQHWSKPAAQLNVSQLTSAVVRLLIEAEVDENLIGRHLIRRANRDGGHAMIGHFETLRIAAAALGSGSSGGGGRRGDRFDFRLRTDALTGHVTGDYGGADFELELTENTGPERKLTVAKEGETFLMVELEEGDVLNRLVQKGDGTVRLLTGSIENLVNLSADNFAALLKAHDNEVRNALLRPLQTFGVQTP